MNDLRFDWYPSLSSPQLEERLALLLEELLKDYKPGRGVPSRDTYEASYRAIGTKLLSAFMLHTIPMKLSLCLNAPGPIRRIS